MPDPMQPSKDLHESLPPSEVLTQVQALLAQVLWRRVPGNGKRGQFIIKLVLKLPCMLLLHLLICQSMAAYFMLKLTFALHRRRR